MKLLNLIATGGKVVVYNAGKYAPEILTGASLIGLAATSFFSAVGYGKAKEAMKRFCREWIKKKSIMGGNKYGKNIWRTLQ